MPIEINVRESRELQAALLALKAVPREVAAAVRKYTRPMVQEAWQAGLRARAVTPLDEKVLVKTARVQVRDTNVVLRSGATGKLKDITRPVEFGADRDKVVTYDSFRNGKRFKVTRHTKRQMSWRREGGRVVYPTAGELIPRLASLWVQTIIRTFYETLEKHRG